MGLNGSPTQGNAGIALMAARVALSAVFVFSGIVKLASAERTAAEMASFGLPAPFVFGLAVGLFQITAGIMLATGVRPVAAALSLALFTSLATLMAHAFWTVPEADRIMQATTFLEHVGLVGGLLLVAAVSAERLERGRAFPSLGRGS